MSNENAPATPVPYEDLYRRTYQWEVTLLDHKTEKHFSLAVAADYMEEAVEKAIWAAATFKPGDNRHADDYEAVGCTRQRLITVD